MTDAGLRFALIVGLGLPAVAILLVGSHWLLDRVAGAVERRMDP